MDEDIEKIISKALHPSRNPEMVRRWVQELDNDEPPDPAAGKPAGAGGSDERLD